MNKQDAEWVHPSNYVLVHCVSTFQSCSLSLVFVQKSSSAKRNSLSAASIQFSKTSKQDEGEKKKDSKKIIHLPLPYKDLLHNTSLAK